MGCFRRSSACLPARALKTHPVARLGPFRSHCPVLAAGLVVSPSPPSKPLRIPGAAGVSRQGSTDLGRTVSRHGRLLSGCWLLRASGFRLVTAARDVLGVLIVLIVLGSYPQPNRMHSFGKPRNPGPQCPLFGPQCPVLGPQCPLAGPQCPVHPQASPPSGDNPDYVRSGGHCGPRPAPRDRHRDTG